MVDKKETYSVSRLTTYEKCPQLYKLTYETPQPDIRSDTEETRLGTICHKAIELFYESSEYESVKASLMKVWIDELKEYHLHMLVPDLSNYGAHLTHLYRRASSTYTGSDAIRTEKGDVPLSPELTKTWDRYVKENSLDKTAGKIDKQAAKAAPNRWKDISMSSVFAQTVGIISFYQHPSEIHSVVSIEFPISEPQYQAATTEGKLLKGEVTTKARGPYPLFKDKEGKQKLLNIENEMCLPELDEDNKIKKNANGEIVWSKTDLFSGYIDLLSRDSEGRLYIIDHKSSRMAASIPKVARHEQLLAYGFAIYHMTGELPYRIGINDLRRAKLVTAPFNLSAAEEAMERLVSIKKAISSKLFYKRDPDGFDTPCVRKGRGGEIKICPGLKYCHPKVYESYSGSQDIF